MSNRFVSRTAVVVATVVGFLGCSPPKPSQPAAQSADAAAVTPPPPPPVPTPAVPAQAATNPPVTTALPPGFVEVVPEPPPPGSPTSVTPPPNFTEVEPQEPATAAEPSPESAAVAVEGGAAAFLAANQVVEDIQNEMHSLLTGVNDDETARAAAAKLPGLVDRWETTSKAATALYLALPQDQRNQAMQKLQQGAIERMKKIEAKDGNLLENIQRLAKSPQRPIVHDALVHLRDTMLAQHSIYAPRGLREHLAKKLGGPGTPLPQ